MFSDSDDDVPGLQPQSTETAGKICHVGAFACGVEASLGDGELLQAHVVAPPPEHWEGEHRQRLRPVVASDSVTSSALHACTHVTRHPGTLGLLVL